MNEIIENDVAVDGPVVNEGERGSSTFSTGQGPGATDRFAGAWAAVDGEAEGSRELSSVCREASPWNLCRGSWASRSSAGGHPGRSGGLSVRGRWIPQGLGSAAGATGHSCVADAGPGLHPGRRPGLDISGGGSLERGVCRLTRVQEWRPLRRPGADQDGAGEALRLDLRRRRPWTVLADG